MSKIGYDYSVRLRSLLFEHIDSRHTVPLFKISSPPPSPIFPRKFVFTATTQYFEDMCKYIMR